MLDNKRAPGGLACAAKLADMSNDRFAYTFL